MCTWKKHKSVARVCWLWHALRMYICNANNTQRTKNKACVCVTAAQSPPLRPSRTFCYARLRSSNMKATAEQFMRKRDCVCIWQAGRRMYIALPALGALYSVYKHLKPNPFLCAMLCCAARNASIQTSNEILNAVRWVNRFALLLLCAAAKCIHGMRFLVTMTKRVRVRVLVLVVL